VDFTELGSAERRGEFFGDETGAASKYSIFGRAASFCPLSFFVRIAKDRVFPGFSLQGRFIPQDT
jgi:hypothetical protein